MFFIKSKDQQYNAVVAEQTRMLFSASTPSSIATFANSSLLVAALWSQVDHASLILWYAFIIVVTLGRLRLNIAYKRSTVAAGEAYRWANRFIVGTTLISALWASASIFLFPAASLEHQVLLAFVVAGMCAGAVTTLSYLKVTIVSYLSLALIPIGIQFLRFAGDVAVIMSIMTAFFYLITVTSGIRIYNNTSENIRIRFKSQDNEKALRQSEVRLRSIFDSAPLGIVYYDQNGAIQSYNPAFARLIAATESIVGKPVQEVFQTPEAIHLMMLSRQGAETIFNGDAASLDNASTPPLRIYFRGILDESNLPIGGIAIIEDRTDDIKVERLKSEFVSTVSHELRTPLTAIKGSLDLMATDVIKKQPHLVDELLANARRNSGRLLTLINDILDLEKIAQGKIEYKMTPTELMPLIEQAITTNTPYGEQHLVTFLITRRLEQVYANIDGHRIMQVLTNLLSNAAKFSPENSRVEVSVYDQDENHVCISVKDYGCGIPSEFHDRIFRKFSQYDGSDVRKVGGTGLGLNISKAIVEHHHGRIEFTSEAGKGTTFFVILPKASQLQISAVD